MKGKGGGSRGDRNFLTFDHFCHCLQKTNTHYHHAKHYTDQGCHGFPASFTQFDVTKRWKNICERARAGGTNQLKNGSKIAGEQRHAHSRNNQGGGEDQVTIWIPSLIREPVVFHHFTTHESLQRERSQHVQAEAATQLSNWKGVFRGRSCLQTSNIDHQIIRGEIIQHVSFGLITKSQKSSQGHKQTCHHGNKS